MNRQNANGNDEALWQLYIQNGDENAFVRLVEPHRKAILAYHLRMIGDRDDAFDLLQETLRRFAVHFNPQRASAKTFLFRIALNLARTHYRQKKRRNEISLEQLFEAGMDFPDVSTESNGKNQIRLLNDAIHQLPVNEQEAIDLKDIQGLTYKAAAEILACSEKRFEKRLLKARKRLAEILKNNKKFEVLSREYS
ncbi:MAG: RNA polymerase sigma factor [Candidatus Omnitrophota bacterium]|jgi:RNA polymerase sigma-70 factor (ECF subfamily)|nr:MAG: RNA polymerase sigma factor [Candidatus Omnitrophota bacterium]